MKHCIIIGAGLGGLSCGVILSKNGYHVTVLEQGVQAGGCLQCFERRGVKFETGMHFIGSADEGQILNNLMRYLELDSIKLSRLDTHGYNVISFGDKQYKIANGREAFIKTLVNDFPSERESLNRYYDLIETVAKSSSLSSLRNASSEDALNTEYQLLSINEVIDSITNNEDLKNVLVGNLPLYAAERDKTPFASHAFIMNFYSHNAFRIVGGSDQLAKSMVATIERLGGQVLTRKKALHIDCNEEQATGVITADGVKYDADVVISSVHPARLLEMLDSKLIRPAYRNRLQNMRNTASVFSVYLHFKKDAVPYMNHNYFRYFNCTPWDCEQYDQHNWPKNYLYMHHCHKEDPQFAESGVILSYMSIDEVKKWNGTSVDNRGEDYRLFKKRKAEKLIETLFIDFPELRGSIEHLYTSTPLTYRDYTGTEDGSMYGVAKDIASPMLSRVPHKTRIPNLLLTGQNINSHGMLGTLVGTIVTCSELLTAETIYQQIIEANKD